MINRVGEPLPGLSVYYLGMIFIESGCNGSMSTRRISNKNRSGTILYSIGIILCILIWAASVWADFEASLFASALPADKSLSTVNCPVVISPNETGQVKAKFSNHLDRPISTNVRTYISLGFVSNIIEINTPLRLQPGETITLQWPIVAENAVWDRVIMARIYTFRSAPYPAYAGTCGILVIDILGISGKYLLTIGLILGLGTLSVGLFILNKRIIPNEVPSLGKLLPMLTSLTIITVAGLGIGLAGYWMPGFLLLILAILLIAVILASEILGK